MLLAEKKEKQLEHLDEAINNDCWWYNDRFRVMNNEAGMGKSIQTFKSIAKLATNTDCKIVYVQMFANKIAENQDAIELKDTVKKINDYAKRNIANYICSKNFKEHKKIMADSQVICITHRKYIELCKSSSSNFITGSDVLIIDEFPNLFESFYISEIELMQLQGFTLLTEKDKSDIMEMNDFIMKKLNELQEKNGAEMRIVNLHKLDVKNYIKILDTIIDNATKDNAIAHKNVIDTAKKALELFRHSSVYYRAKAGNKKYPVLYSYFKDVTYILAKESNIILDANGSFDMRYKLQPKLFQLDRQSKVYDYKNSTINLYPISTTKTSLKNYKNIISDVVEYIGKNSKGFGQRDNLIVTDIASENKVTEFQKAYYETMEDIYITHFGALIGKNYWKDCNYAWILKTPFYPWVQYILQYLFYRGKDLNGNISCQINNKKGDCSTYSIFKNDEFNKFKNSIVLGELYQACKRIARDGRECTFNILMADEDIFELLTKQFKNIRKGIKTDLEIKRVEKKEDKKKGKKPIKGDRRSKMIQEYIINAKKEGKDKILKTDVCNIADLRIDKFSKQIKSMKKWITENNIKIGQGKEREYIFI